MVDPLNVKQALRALVANTPREPAPVSEPERDPIKRLGNKIQTDIIKETPPGLLERAGSTAASGLSVVGNLLDVPGSMARDVLTWLPGGPKPANPFDQLLSPFSEKNRTTGRDLNRGYGLSGKDDTMLNFMGGMATEILTDPLTYLTLGAGALTKGGKAARAAGLMDNAPEIASKLLKRKVGKGESRHVVTPRMLLENVQPAQRSTKLDQLKRMGMTDEDMDRQLGGLLRINLPFSDKPFSWNGKPITFGGLTDESGVVGAGKIKFGKNNLPPGLGPVASGLGGLPPAPPSGASPQMLPTAALPVPGSPQPKPAPTSLVPNTPASQQPSANVPSVNPKTPSSPAVTAGALDTEEKGFVDGITQGDKYNTEDLLGILGDSSPSRYYGVLDRALKQKSITKAKYNQAQERLANHYAKGISGEWKAAPEGRVLEIKAPGVGSVKAVVSDSGVLTISDLARENEVTGSGKALISRVKDLSASENVNSVFMPISDNRTLNAFSSVFGDDNVMYANSSSKVFQSKADAAKAIKSEPVFVLKRFEPKVNVEAKPIDQAPVVDKTLANIPKQASETSPTVTAPAVSTVAPKTDDVVRKSQALVREIASKRGASDAEVADMILRGDVRSAIRRLERRPLEGLKLDGLKSAITKNGIMNQEQADDLFSKLKTESARLDLKSLGGDTRDIVDGLLSKDPVTSLRALIHTRNVPSSRITDIADQLSSKGALNDYDLNLIKVEAETAEILKRQFANTEVRNLESNQLKTAEDKAKKLEEIEIKARDKAEQLTSRRDAILAANEIDRLEGAKQFLEKLRQSETPLGQALVTRKRDMLSLERVGDRRDAARKLISKKRELMTDLYRKRWDYVINLSESKKIEIDKIKLSSAISDPPLTTGVFDEVDRAFVKEIGDDADLLFKNIAEEAEEDFLDKKVEGRSSSGNTIFSRSEWTAKPYEYGKSTEVDWKRLDPLPDEAKRVVGNMVSRLDEQFLDGITLRYGGQGPDAGAMARIDLTNGLIDIFDNSIRAERVTEDTIHELWHHLSRYFTDDEVRSVSDEYQRALAAFANKNPGEAVPYHLSTIDEYVGKTMADLSIKYLGKPKPEGLLATAWGKMLDVFEYLWDTALKTFGYNQTKSIMRDFLSGKRSPTRLTDNTLASRVDDVFSAVLESRTKPGGMYLNRAFEDEWFVKSARAVENFPMKVATASQWEAAIKKAGVTKNEIEDLNLGTLFTDGSLKLTKEQVMGHIADNVPHVSVIKHSRRKRAVAMPDYSGYTVPVAGTRDATNDGYIEIIVYGRSGDSLHNKKLTTTGDRLKWAHGHFPAITPKDAPVISNYDDVINYPDAKNPGGPSMQPVSWGRAVEATVDIPSKRNAKTLIITEVQSDIHQRNHPIVLTKAEEVEVSRIRKRLKELHQELKAQKAIGKGDDVRDEIAKQSEKVREVFFGSARRHFPEVIKKINSKIGKFNKVIERYDGYITDLVAKISQDDLAQIKPGSFDMLMNAVQDLAMMIERFNSVVASGNVLTAPRLSPELKRKMLTVVGIANQGILNQKVIDDLSSYFEEIYKISESVQSSMISGESILDFGNDFYVQENFLPHMSFGNSWHRLSMKASLKHAIDNGFDAIAIVNGKDSARAVNGPPKELEEFYNIITKDFSEYVKKFGSGPVESNWRRRFGLRKEYAERLNELRFEHSKLKTELHNNLKSPDTASGRKEYLRIMDEIDKVKKESDDLTAAEGLRDDVADEERVFDRFNHAAIFDYNGDMTVYPITDKMKQEIGPQSLWSRVPSQPSTPPQALSSREIAQQLSDYRSPKIAMALDNLVEKMSDSAVGRQVNALFDQSVLGALSKVGQRVARLAFGGYKDSVVKMRKDMAPLIRTWVGLDKINEEFIAANELAPLADYIRQYGNKVDAEKMRMKDARVIRNQRYNGLLRLAETSMLDDVNRSYIPITAQDVAREAPWIDATKVDNVAEMLNKFRYFNLDMINREELRGVMVSFLNRYFPRLRSPLPGASDMPWNPNFGEILDPTHPHQRKRDSVLDGYSDGTSVVNDISVDPEFSGIFSKRNIKEDVSALEIDDLANRIWQKYGNRLDEANASMSFDALPGTMTLKLKGLARKMGSLDYRHVDNAIPLFSADMVSAMMQRLEHSYRASSHADVIRDLVTESVLHKSFYQIGNDKATNLRIALVEGDYSSPMAVARVIRNLKSKAKDVIYDADKKIWDVKIEPVVQNMNAAISQGQFGSFVHSTLNQTEDFLLAPLASKDEKLGLHDYLLRLTYDRSDPTDLAKQRLEIVEVVPQQAGTNQINISPLVNPKTVTKNNYRSNMPSQFLLEALTVPRETADEIKRFVRPPRLLGEVVPLVRYSDKFTNVWKMMQTGMLPFLAFHTRNLGSGQASNLFTGIQKDPRFAANIADPTSWINLIRSFTQPVADAHAMATGGVIKGASEIPEYKAKGLTDEQATERLRQEVFAQGIIGERQGLSAEQLRESVDAVSSQYPGIAGSNSINPLKWNWSKPASGSTFSQRWLQPWMMKGGLAEQDIFRPGQLGKDLAGYTESLNRLAPYISMRRQGFDPREAAKLINEAQVDYTALSNFNRDYTRRLFPFAAYTIGIAPTVARTLTQRPGGLMGQTVMATTKAGQNAEQGVTPDYIRETASIPLGMSEDGTRSYITGFGLPFEDPLQFAQIARGDVSGTLREIGSRLNPIPKALIETMTGESLYQSGPFGGREIEDLDPTIGRIGANIKDLITGSKTEQATPLMNNPWLEYAIMNSGLGRSLNTIRTATDPRKYDTIPWKLLLNLGTGVRVADVSPSAQDAILRERLARVMKDFGGRMYTRPYFPDYAQENWTPEEAADAAQIEAIMKILNQRSADRKKMRDSQ